MRYPFYSKNLVQNRLFAPEPARAAHARDADELARTREQLTLVLAKAGEGRQKTAAKPVAGRRKSVSPGVSVKRRPPRTPRT
jgi:hypothetical protein